VALLSDLLQRDRSSVLSQRLMGLMSLLAPQTTGGGGSSYTGGTGDFNATHEGPGTGGLQFGVQDPHYSALAQNLLDVIERRFPESSPGGIFAPRNIAGTNTPSEHAYGAAADIMVGSNALGDAINQFLSRPRVANRFGYSNVLWEVPDHFNHLHAGWLY
jgi:hypothetical protein